MAAWLLDARRTNGTHGDYARALNDADIDCTLLWSTEELGMLQASGTANKAWAAPRIGLGRVRPNGRTSFLRGRIPLVALRDLVSVVPDAMR